MYQITPSAIRCQGLNLNEMTGEELKKMREEAGLSRTRLGMKMGFTGTAGRINNRIYDYEAERRSITPAIETLLRMILEEEARPS